MFHTQQTQKTKILKLGDKIMVLKENIILISLFIFHSYVTITLYANKNGILDIWSNHYNRTQIKYVVYSSFILTAMTGTANNELYKIYAIIITISISINSCIFIYHQVICAGLIITNSALSGLLYISTIRYHDPTYYTGHIALIICSIICLYRILGPDERFERSDLPARLFIGSPCIAILILSTDSMLNSAALQDEFWRRLNTIGTPAAPYPSLIINELIPIAAFSILASIPLITAFYIHKVIKLRLHELSETREKLEKALIEQQNTTAMLSHEFCGPLASISAACQLIEYSGKHYDEELYTEINRIKRTTNRLAQLSESWLTDGFARLSSSSNTTETFSLRDLLGELATEYRCELSPPPMSARFSGDRNTLLIALSSVIENARKYSGPQGKVEIRCETQSNVEHRMKSKRKAEIYITDDGPGIEPGHEEKIFEKYYRSKSTKHKKGNGIGLHIAKSCVWSIGGTIIAYNNKKTDGCTFKFTIPLS